METFLSPLDDLTHTHNIINHMIEVRFGRAINFVTYGTEDPTGGNGEQSYIFKQLKEMG